ncbi:MAG: glycosyltransferase family 39 protein [Candidatus Levybacteria bacterium]|nr:glycosyltransferase family 39 protein [Candidatus Levybacteria bacterium]
MMKLASMAEQSVSFWFLFITSFFFFLLRLPSLFEPYWYGDEGIYQVLGHAIRNGRLLYEGIWDNKPPLLYLIYAFFNSDQFALRLASLIFGIVSVIAFYALARELFKERFKVALWITSFFALLFGLPLIEGNIANSENFMLLPLILAGLILVKSQRYRLLAGLLVALAFLIKIVGVFDFAAFFLFLLFTNTPSSLTLRGLKTEVKRVLPFLIGFFTPIILVSLFFFFKGAFSDYIQASFLQNVGYVGYGNRLIIPQGLLILKLLTLGGVALFIFIRRSQLPKSFIFIYLWFAFSMFNTFFAGRPYTHYLLVLLPSLSLLIGLIITSNQYKKLTLAFFIVSFILILNNFRFYGKTIYYYQNFISFLTGGKSVAAYRGFFDRNTPRDYRLVQFIKMNTGINDNIFIWGNNAQVYALTDKLPPGRYAVAYHITAYKDGKENTEKGIAKGKPKLIIIMPNVPPLKISLIEYREISNIGNAKIYERIF